MTFQVSALGALALLLVQRFLIHIPFLENVEDRPGAETAASQLTEDARRLLLIFWLHQALPPQIFAGLLLFANALESRVHGLIDHVAMHALNFEVSDDSMSPKFLIVPPQRRKIGRILRVVEIT